MPTTDRSQRCWICGRPRGIAQRRQEWTTNLPTVFVPRTENEDDRPAQISNDVRVGAYVYRNGGANHETHICDDCLRVGLRALKNELSALLGELDSGHDLESELADATARLASTQCKLHRVCHDHNRMQDRLRYALSKLDPGSFDDDDELEAARWETTRGKATDHAND